MQVRREPGLPTIPASGYELAVWARAKIYTDLESPPPPPQPPQPPQPPTTSHQPSSLPPTNPLAQIWRHTILSRVRWDICFFTSTYYWRGLTFLEASSTSSGWLVELGRHGRAPIDAKAISKGHAYSALSRVIGKPHSRRGFKKARLKSLKRRDLRGAL